MDKEEKEKMIFLFKSASNLLDSVEDSKKNLDMLIENYNLQNSNLNKSIKELNNSVVNINERIQKEVKSKSCVIADTVVNHISTNFKEANKYANEATELYKNVSNSIIYKVFFISLISFMFFTGVAYFGYTFYLQKSIETLEEALSKLKEYTQKIHICGERNSYSKAHLET